MEYCKLGTLYDLIESKNKYKLEMPEDRCWKIIAQFFIALSVMNSFNMAHRDVKDGNILIDDDDNIKITDYGLSKEASFSSNKFNTFDKGTMFILSYIYLYISIHFLYRPYMAPEVINSEFFFFFESFSFFYNHFQ
jgi:serine/threonine protein kinase